MARRKKEASSNGPVELDEDRLDLASGGRRSRAADTFDPPPPAGPGPIPIPYPN